VEHLCVMSKRKKQKTAIYHPPKPGMPYKPVSVGNKAYEELKALADYF
jgi:hypothetical protein